MVYQGGARLDMRLSGGLGLSAGALYTHGLKNVDAGYVIDGWKNRYYSRSRTLSLQIGLSYTVGRALAAESPRTLARDAMPAPALATPPARPTLVQEVRWPGPEPGNPARAAYPLISASMPSSPSHLPTTAAPHESL